MKITKTTVTAAHKIYAAEDEFDDMTFDDFDDDMGRGSDVEMTDSDLSEDEIQSQLDSISDSIDDLQDGLDDMSEDDVSIEIDNNIGDHYIAECDKCQGIFISAIVQSTQPISKITGICPLCNEETEQYLKWVVKDVE